MPETMKLLVNIKRKIIQNKNGEKVTNLEITEVHSITFFYS